MLKNKWIKNKLLNYLNSNNIIEIKKWLINDLHLKTLISGIKYFISKKCVLNNDEIQIFKMIINEINKKDLIINNKPLLFYFVKIRDYNVIKFLLKNGYNININHKNNSVWNYYFVSKIENFDILNWFFEYNINTKYLDKKLNTPIILCIKYGFIFSFDLILKNSFELIDCQNVDGNTALHYACSFNNLYIFKILINFNANPDLKNKKNDKPINLTNNYKIRNYLINIKKYKENRIKKTYSYREDNLVFNKSSKYSKNTNSGNDILSKNSMESKNKFNITKKIRRTESIDFEIKEEYDNSKKYFKSITLPRKKKMKNLKSYIY